MSCAGSASPATRLLICLAALLIPVAAIAGSGAEWSAEPRRLHLEDLVTITLTLDGGLASLPTPTLPLTGLEIVGEPSVSSEFSWVNGVVSRRKVIRYEAMARESGDAIIGPLQLSSEAHPAVLLSPIAIEVLKPLLSGTDDPATILERLEGASQERVFIVAESDRKSVVVGEQLLVTWFLYTAEPVRDVHMGGNPPMRDFWTESVPLTGDVLSQLRLGGTAVQKLAIRRVAIFPTRAGRLEVPPAQAAVELVRPIDDPFRGLGGGMFRRFEGSVVTVRRRSAPLSIDVLETPGNANVVGSYQLLCGQPKVAAVGPVSFDVMLSGPGNLRSSKAPRFVTAPRGSVEIQEGGVTVDRKSATVAMSRRWRFLLFPRESGTFLIPEIAVTTYDPALASVRILTCSEQTLQVSRPTSTAAAEPEGWRDRGGAGASLWFLAPVALLLTLAGVYTARRKRRLGITAHDLAELLSSRESPSTLRRMLTEQVSRRGLDSQELFRSHGSAGESFRALHSLIDRMEKEPSSDAGTELEQRARAWLRASLSVQEGGARASAREKERNHPF
ncbi:MAG TPA: BatD family protein [Thermoanaerobaculia bacterium]|nr:BatD family protein [Thermoanaerobaculia bacterium]